MPKPIENLTWKIATLEAKAGLEPRLPRAMKAIKGSEADQNQGAQLASTELETLKAKQFQQKFFHARKSYRKAIKKICAFELQASVKKLKTCQNQLDKLRETLNKEFGVCAQGTNAAEEALSEEIPQKLRKAFNKLRNRHERTTFEIKNLKTLNMDLLAQLLLAAQLRNSGLNSYSVIDALCEDLEKTGPDVDTADPKSEMITLLQQSKHFEACTQEVMSQIEHHARSLLTTEAILLSSDTHLDEKAMNSWQRESNDARPQKKHVEAKNHSRTEKSKPASGARTISQKVDSEPQDNHIASDTDSVQHDSFFVSKAPGQIEYRSDVEYDSDLYGSADEQDSEHLRHSFNDASDSEIEKLCKNNQSANRRKNRLGQQARRKIWEKKFGQHARHIQSGQKSTEQLHQEKIQQKKQERYLMKRKADASTAGNTREKKQRHDSYFSTNQEPASNTRKMKEEETLHPSWEAKRKQKQMILPAQGQKIKFADDE